MKEKHPYHDESMWKGAKPINFINAKIHRKNMTKAEMILWNELKTKKLNGYKFRRQHPITKYIADFYCHELKLIIEVDGGYHNNKEQIEYDNTRDNLLKLQNVQILRFTNEEVFKDIQSVKHKILIEAEKIKAS